MRKKNSSSSGRRLIGLAALAVPIAAFLVYWLAFHHPKQPNIVLITLESVRADHLGCYGYDKPTSPALDALAKEGVIYENAQAVTSWTLTAHASIFTGLYPDAHQVTGPFSRLDDKYTTITEALANAGYYCAGVISGPYLSRAHNVPQGFQHYNENPSAESQSLSHSKVTGREMEAGLRHVINVLRDRKKPMFLFAYFWDPHYDYIPPAPYDHMFVTPDCQPIDIRKYESSGRIHPGMAPGELAYVKSQYDGEIRWTDEHLGRVFDALKAQHMWDNTAIIVLADHGEEFFEHGEKGHKKNLYTESVRIPLIIKYPKGVGVGRDARLASQVDIFPTILELAHAQSDQPNQGLSLLGPVPPSSRTAYMELLTANFFPKRGGGFEAREVKNWYGARQGDYQLIVQAEAERRELYNMRADPGQRTNIFGQEGTPSNMLISLLQEGAEQDLAIAKVYGISTEAKLDESALENLRSLGYVQ
ncbi:MAG: sulfatase [Candidatus Eisenbacteria bacterium]|nr:sulfatase [Candidatus Eisenbacteria bacterium]